jgi:uncharacterized membrane protein YbhN (UPF0104 family)
VVANALLATIAILLGLGFWLLGELRFLVPYKPLLIREYGYTIVFWIVVTFVNVFAAAYTVQRKFLLKDTGRKLSHLDKEVLSGSSPIPSTNSASEAEIDVA